MEIESLHNKRQCIVMTAVWDAPVLVPSFHSWRRDDFPPSDATGRILADNALDIVQIFRRDRKLAVR
jgi:hypothetical protein